MEAADYLALREGAGLTRAQVAGRTGYDRSHVSRVESGGRGASAEYEALFRRAVSPDYKPDDSRLSCVVVPALRARKAIGTANLDLKEAICDLEKLRGVLNYALRAARSVADQADVLAEGAVTIGTNKFNPNRASQEDMEKVTDYICSVMLEMMVDHRFHLLSNGEIEEYVRTLAARVARETKQARNRSR